MSTLTKEANDLRDDIIKFKGVPDKCTTHHYACHCMNRRIVDLIDRLSARCEELESERASLNSIVCGLEDESRDRLGDKIRLTNRLTELLEAVEPIMERVSHLNTFGESTTVSVSSIVNLGNVVRKIKEGK